MDIRMLLAIVIGFGVAGCCYLAWWAYSMGRWLQQERKRLEG